MRNRTLKKFQAGEFDGLKIVPIGFRNKGGSLYLQHRNYSPKVVTFAVSELVSDSPETRYIEADSSRCGDICGLQIVGADIHEEEVTVCV